MAESDHITTGRSPAFQFYPDDFIAGTVTLLTEEVGAYMLLMCHCWNKGSIPADIPSLARITRLTPARMQKAWLALRPKFQQLESGDLFQPRIERERRKQAEFRAEQKRKGLASAAARAARPTKAQPNVNRGSTSVATEPQPDTQPNVNSSISYLQSPDFSQEQTRASARDPLAERAGEFIERYKVLHVKLRKGAHYIGRPVLDFQEAMQLVAVYDDTRLDKLAYVWLNTDHDFAQSGTRSLAKFRSMASWCEEQLIEWESRHGELQVTA